jgi:signal transduction histidine kinase
MIAIIKKWLRYIGPYPYNPYLIFLFFFALFFSRFLPLIAYLPVGHERWRAAGIIILASGIPSGTFAIGALLLNRYRVWSNRSLIFYILEVACFQYLNLHFLPQINAIVKKYVGHSYETLIGISVNIFISSLVLSLAALALMHQAERKINERLLLAKKLVEKLEHERSELIDSDENLRQQTSQFLHDRVQSDLMVIGMKLRSISGQSSPEVNEVINGVIGRIEETRGSDLKNLIQGLSPNLEVATLSSALEILLARYKQDIEISLQIDSATEELDQKIKLGIYRIIEQATLNSLMHGPAGRVEIIVNTSPEGQTTIVVSDDGPGVSIQEVSAGVGSAVVDSWVGILKGHRVIDTEPGFGYRLQVKFPE